MSYQTITLQNFYEQMKEDHTTVLDVRTPEEYESGHIPKSINIPVQVLTDRLNELSKDEKYLIICRSGARSQMASSILVQNGFANILNCEEGMMTWPYDVSYE